MRCDYRHSDKQLTVFRRRLLVAFPGQTKFQKEGRYVTYERKGKVVLVGSSASQSPHMSSFVSLQLLPLTDK